MIWWHVVDGVAHAFPDTAEVRARVDNQMNVHPSRRERWFGTIEGCIKHAGVKATAFKRTTERTYDAALWLKTGQHVPVGHVTVTEITASPAGCEGAVTRHYDDMLPIKEI
jgi:hypothetical protein